MLPDIGWSELLIVAAVALIVVGPKDLPRMLRTIAKYVGAARRMARDFQSSLDDIAKDTGLDEVKRDMQGLTNFDHLDEDPGTPLKPAEAAKAANAVSGAADAAEEAGNSMASPQTEKAAKAAQEAESAPAPAANGASDRSEPAAKSPNAAPATSEPDVPKPETSKAPDPAKDDEQPRQSA